MVKRFLNDYTLGKISIYKSDPRKWMKVLRENIPLDILPKYFGGDLVDPDGDSKCPSKVFLHFNLLNSFLMHLHFRYVKVEKFPSLITQKHLPKREVKITSRRW